MSYGKLDSSLKVWDLDLRDPTAGELIQNITQQNYKNTNLVQIEKKIEEMNSEKVSLLQVYR